MRLLPRRHRNPLLPALLLAASLLALSCSSEPGAADYEKKGAELATQGQWQEAIAEYDRAIGKDPGLQTAIAGRGHAYLQLRQLDAAIVDLERAHELDPSAAAVGDELTQALRLRAQDAITRNDLDAAIEDLERAYSLTPSAPGIGDELAQALKLRAGNAATRGDLDAAGTDLGRALAVAPSQAGETLLAMSALAQQRGVERAKTANTAALEDFRSALDLLERSHQASPLAPEYLGVRQAMLHVEIGDLQVMLGQYDAGFASYNTAIALAPGYSAAYEARSSLYFLLHATELGRPNYVELAARDMAMAVDLGLDDAFYARLAGVWFWQARDIPNALKYLSLAIAWIEEGRPYRTEGPVLSAAYEYRARTYGLLGDCARVRADWQRAIETAGDATRLQYLNREVALNIYGCFR